MIVLKRGLFLGLPAIEVYRDDELQFATSDRDELVELLEGRFKIENPGPLVDAAPVHGEVRIYLDAEVN